MRKQMILLPLVFMLSGCSIVDSSSEISISLPSEMIVNREFTIGGYDSEMRVTVSNESVASVKDGTYMQMGWVQQKSPFQKERHRKAMILV